MAGARITGWKTNERRGGDGARLTVLGANACRGREGEASRGEDSKGRCPNEPSKWGAW